MEIGIYLDFYYNGFDDNIERFTSQSRETLELSNSKGDIDTLDLFISSSSRVQFLLKMPNCLHIDRSNFH